MKWKMVRLGDVGTIVTGNTPQTNDHKNYSSNDFCFYKPGDFAEYKVTVLEDAENYISDYAREKARIIPSQSVLVTCIGIIGKVGITTEESSCNQQINAIIPNLSICHPSYLAYAILYINNHLNHIANAAVVSIINKSQFSNIEIPLPPLPAQQKIAGVLDRANTLIENRKAQIEKLDLLVKSQFIEMFGDPVTNPMGWEVKKLGDYTEFLTSGSRGWSGYFANDGEMFITIKNVKNGAITTDNMQYVHAPNTKESERTRVKTGDLLISITADLGRTGVVEPEISDYGAYINQHLSLVRLNKEHVNPFYIAHYLETNAGKRQFDSKNQIGVKAGLNFNAINSLTVMTPPLDLQDSFHNFVKRVKAQKAQLNKSVALLELNYKSLMQKCFSGEIAM